MIHDAGASLHQDINLVRRLACSDDNLSRSEDPLLRNRHQSLEVLARKLLANLQILEQWVPVRVRMSFHFCWPSLSPVITWMFKATRRFIRIKPAERIAVSGHRRGCPEASLV